MSDFSKNSEQILNYILQNGQDANQIATNSLRVLVEQRLQSSFDEEIRKLPKPPTNSKLKVFEILNNLRPNLYSGPLNELREKKFTHDNKIEQLQVKFSIALRILQKINLRDLNIVLILQNTKGPMAALDFLLSKIKLGKAIPIITPSK